MGICHTCTRRKTAGTVRNLITGAVSTEPDDDVQICVSVPVGDVDLSLQPQTLERKSHVTEQDHPDPRAGRRIRP